MYNNLFKINSIVIVYLKNVTGCKQIRRLNNVSLENKKDLIMFVTQPHPDGLMINQTNQIGISEEDHMLEQCIRQKRHYCVYLR